MGGAITPSLPGGRRGKKQAPLPQLLLSDQPWPLLPVPYWFLSTGLGTLSLSNLVDLNWLTYPLTPQCPQKAWKFSHLLAQVPSATPFLPPPGKSGRWGAAVHPLLMASMEETMFPCFGPGAPVTLPGLWVEMVWCELQNKKGREEAFTLC